MDRTNGALDKAIIAFRANPTPENRAALMTAAKRHNEHFVREQTGNYIERTK